MVQDNNSNQYNNRNSSHRNNNSTNHHHNHVNNNDDDNQNNTTSSASSSASLVCGVILVSESSSSLNDNLTLGSIVLDHDDEGVFFHDDLKVSELRRRIIASQVLINNSFIFLSKEGYVCLCFALHSIVINALYCKSRYPIDKNNESSVTSSSVINTSCNGIFIRRVFLGK